MTVLSFLMTRFIREWKHLTFVSPSYWVLGYLTQYIVSSTTCLPMIVLIHVSLKLNKMVLNTYVLIRWWAEGSGVHVLVVANAAVDEPGWTSVSLVGNSLHWVYTQSRTARSYGRSISEKLPIISITLICTLTNSKWENPLKRSFNLYFLHGYGWWRFLKVFISHLDFFFWEVCSVP